MKLFRKLDDFPDSLRGGAISIGNFDGVHRGHSRIVSRLNRYASELGSAAIVFTFDPHPVRLLRPEQTPPPLTWTRRKADLLADLGVDVVIAYPTNLALLELEAEEFFQQIVCQKIGAKAMVEGPNFFFGKGRGGNIDTLKSLCHQNKVELEIVKPIENDGKYVSSSRIRTLIADGDVRSAREYLTQPYRIRGMVTHGAARGTTIGFPTANLDAIDTLVPAIGVYAGRAWIESRWHWAAINIGPNPTFGEQLPKVEVHVLDFDGTLYGRPLEVDFIEHLRDIRQFESPDKLIEQLNQDVLKTRQIARQFSSPHESESYDSRPHR